MSVATETLIVESEGQPLDLILFRRFGLEYPGLVEATLDANRGLADGGLFLPVGTRIVVPLPAPPERQEPRRVVRLWG